MLDAVGEGGTLRAVENDFAADRGCRSAASREVCRNSDWIAGAAADVERKDRARCLRLSCERSAEVRAARDEQSCAIENLSRLRRRSERRIVVKRAAGVKLSNLRDGAGAGNSRCDDLSMDGNGIVHIVVGSKCRGPELRYRENKHEHQRQGEHRHNETKPAHRYPLDEETHDEEPLGVGKWLRYYTDLRSDPIFFRCLGRVQRRPSRRVTNIVVVGSRLACGLRRDVPRTSA
jgi:hypothetical protein